MLNQGLYKEFVRSGQVGIFCLEFARNYVITMRPYLLFVSGITGMAGLALSPETEISKLIIYSLIFFLSYGFGQALTDCLQIDTDALSSPYRPLVQGKIGRGAVAVVSLTGLLVGGAVLVNANRANVIWVLMSIVGLATYTFFKRRWWAGPFYNAGIVGALCLIGNLTGSPKSTSFDISARAWAAASTAFFGYANFVLVGYYKDVSADRATGYMTLPVVFGFKVSAVASDIFAALTSLSFAATLWLILDGAGAWPAAWPSAAFALAGMVALLWAQIRQHKVTDENVAHGAIATVVHAYLLILSAICVASRPEWALPLFFFYLAFIAFMKSRPVREQI